MKKGIFSMNKKEEQRIFVMMIWGEDFVAKEGEMFLVDMKKRLEMNKVFQLD